MHCVSLSTTLFKDEYFVVDKCTEKSVKFTSYNIHKQLEHTYTHIQLHIQANLLNTAMQ